LSLQVAVVPYIDFWWGVRKGGNEMVKVLVLVLFVAAVTLWWRHATRPRHLAAPAAKRGARSSYHCVEVRTGTPACEAAQHLGNARFLSGEAPGLPVPGCSEQHCTCSYVHHDDRRDDDRRNPYGQWANLPLTIKRERRSRTERRQSQEGAFRPSIAR
jgi:hypothetical protein